MIREVSDNGRLEARMKGMLEDDAQTKTMGGRDFETQPEALYALES